MNAVAADLDRLLSELTESEKRRAFTLLAQAIFPEESAEGLTPIYVRNDVGRLIGYYVSFPEINPEDFPPPSPAYLAELERRTREPGETIPIEEFLSSFTSRSKGGPDGRKSTQRK